METVTTKIHAPNLKTLLLQEGKEKTRLYKKLSGKKTFIINTDDMREELSKLSKKQLQTLKSLKLKNTETQTLLNGYANWERAERV